MIVVVRKVFMSNILGNDGSRQQFLFDDEDVSGFVEKVVVEFGDNINLETKISITDSTGDVVLNLSKDKFPGDDLVILYPRVSLCNNVGDFVWEDNDVTKMDKFFVFGRLHLFVEGLGEDKAISSVSVYIS